MPVLNPLQMLMMLKNGNPRDIAQQLIKQNFPNDPNMQKLIELGNNGDTQTLEKIANQILAPQGKNLSDEMKTLQSALNNL